VEQPRVVERRASEIFRRSTAIVTAERVSFNYWDSLDDPQRKALLVSIQKTMLRLLADPRWVPASLSPLGPGGRLEVTFVVGAEEISEVEDELVAQRALRDELLDLARRLRRT
jgi:hypothetical protein